MEKLELFSESRLLKTNQIKLKTKTPIYSKEKQKIKKIQEKISKIKTVKKVKLYPLIKLGYIQKKKLQPIGTTEKTPTKQKSKSTKKKTKRSKGHFHIFFDIDSTITHEGVDTPHDNVKTTFQKLRELHNCAVYFCTGRSAKNVRQFITDYKTNDYGIAENGGIILGIEPEEKGRRGDRDEVMKFIKYLDDKNIDYVVDSNQHPRTTEFVIMQDSVDKKKFFNAVKSTRAKIEVHASKNTYHISKKKVNKGTSILFLTSPSVLNLDTNIEKKVAVGDSGLDTPMFEYCDKGYLVGNPDDEVLKEVKKFGKKVKKIKLVGPKALEMIYKNLFPHG